MPDLQAAFDEFKSEVAGLEKQKTGLIQDLVVLTSRKGFLEKSIKELGIAKNLAKSKYDDKINALIEDLEAVEIALDERKIDLKLALDKIDDAKTELKTLEDRIADETTKLDKQLKAKKNEITEAEKLKTMAIAESGAISKQTIAERGKLDKITARVKEAQAEADSEIAEIGKSVVTVQAKLKELNDKIDDKAKQYEDLTDDITAERAKLSAITKKHNDFLEYEKRAKKALEARESSLLQGERNLAEAKRRSRTSVLDNVA